MTLRRAALALVSVLWLAATGTVTAHAELLSSDPAAGSTIGPVRDTPIVLTFSEALKAGSKADIIGPGGRIGTATIDRYDDTKLVFTPTAPLAPGKWSIDWTSIAIDGHILRNKVQFSVAAVPTTSPTSSPSPSPPPDPVNSTSTDVLVPVIAAIFAILVLGLVLLRSRRASVRR